MSYREALERAAAQWGVGLEYSDTWGRRHTASDEALHATLTALGVGADTPEQVDASIAERNRQQWSQALPGTLVVRLGHEALRLHIPVEKQGASLKLELEWEGGELEHHWFFTPELQELERWEGFIAKRLPLPAELRLGYHRLRVYWVQEPQLERFAEAHFIVVPHKARTLDRRVAGLAVSLYGLRSARNWGIGDTTDLQELVEAFVPSGIEFLALNPLHALANRQPFNISPYLPECSLYRNFVYLDVEQVPGYNPAEAPEELADLRDSEFVEYEAVARVKYASLQRAFRWFRGDPKFDAFCAREGQDLKDYATYCFLWQAVHGALPDVWLWTEWPEHFRDPRSPEVQDWVERHPHEVQFWMFVQWQLDEQFARVQARAKELGMQIGLYHDLALATDGFGADLWMNRKFYRTGARVGAPPDELAPGGQDWGFPPPDRDVHRDDGYRLFSKVVRNNARHGGALRIDHVMRFFRLFWIPDALTAAQGCYVHDYAEDLLGILALESERQGFIIIGEDLGTVEWEIRHRLGEAGIYGYRLFWFEKNGDGNFRPPHEYPEHAAVSTTTHDLATLAGFPLGRDIEARKAAGLVDEYSYQQQWNNRNEELHRFHQALEHAGCPGDALAFVLKTPAQIAIVNEQDLTGEPEQQNLPASTWQFPNWRRKMRVPVEEVGELVEVLAKEIQKSGRLG